jgi:hypothetical protein
MIVFFENVSDRSEAAGPRHTPFGLNPTRTFHFQAEGWIMSS